MLCWLRHFVMMCVVWEEGERERQRERERERERDKDKQRKRESKFTQCAPVLIHDTKMISAWYVTKTVHARHYLIHIQFQQSLREYTLGICLLWKSGRVVEKLITDSYHHIHQTYTYIHLFFTLSMCDSLWLFLSPIGYGIQHTCSRHVFIIHFEPIVWRLPTNA